MGYDMHRIDAPPNSPGQDYFRLNIRGMGKMRELVDGILCDTPHPPFPSEPLGWDESTTEEFCEWSGDSPTQPHAREDFNIHHRETRAQLGFRSAHTGKVSAYKFGSNDGWVVVPDECTILADEAALALGYLEEGHWRHTVIEWIDFNRGCARLGGYTVC